MIESKSRAAFVGVCRARVECCRKVVTISLRTAGPSSGCDTSE
jgi:hypothetical protein